MSEAGQRGVRPSKNLGKVLVVDPEVCIRDSLQQVLGSEGYQVLCASTATEAFETLDSEKIAVVIADYYLDVMNGVDFLARVEKEDRGVEMILTTAYPDLTLAQTLLEKGLFDLVSKPFHAYEILLAVKRAFEKRRVIVESADFRQSLKKKIKEQTLSLRLRNQEKQQLLINTIKSLVQTLEAKDKYTEGHSRRVAENSLEIAQNLGLDYREQEEIHLAGLMHDIGKIGIKESVLNKRGRLTDEEYTHIKKHPLISQRILEPIPQFKRVIQMIRNHHEFYDGSGYPDGLTGKNIPAGARILTVCDAFDAMTSDRPYRPALDRDKAFMLIARAVGTQFDPTFARIFFKIKGRIFPEA